jgi:hypothetical protein
MTLLRAPCVRQSLRQLNPESSNDVLESDEPIGQFARWDAEEAPRSE